MRLVSEAFKEAMKDRRDFKQRATVTLSDGTIINIDGSRFTISNNYCSVSSEETILPLGQAISKIIQIEISNYDGEFDSVDFSKARFALDIQFDLPEYFVVS